MRKSKVLFFLLLMVASVVQAQMNQSHRGPTKCSPFLAEHLTGQVFNSLDLRGFLDINVKEVDHLLNGLELWSVYREGKKQWEKVAVAAVTDCTEVSLKIPNVDMISPCDTVDHQELKPGQTCKTKKGAVYMLLRSNPKNETWVGPDGNEWTGRSGLFDIGRNMYELFHRCEEYLNDWYIPVLTPTYSQYQNAVKFGLEEVFPRLMSGYCMAMKNEPGTDNIWGDWKYCFDYPGNRLNHVFYPSFICARSR